MCSGYCDASIVKYSADFFFRAALLSDGELPFENLDDIKKGESLLAKLTEQAIRVLKKNPDGFLLVVEGWFAKTQKRRAFGAYLCQILDLGNVYPEILGRVRSWGMEEAVRTR